MLEYAQIESYDADADAGHGQIPEHGTNVLTLYG